MVSHLVIVVSLLAVALAQSGHDDSDIFVSDDAEFEDLALFKFEDEEERQAETAPPPAPFVRGMRNLGSTCVDLRKHRLNFGLAWRA